MELGPIQKEWIKSLREHGERQTTCHLGSIKANGTYTACCLGELLMVRDRMAGKESFPEGPIMDGVFTTYLDESYKQLGLRDGRGRIGETSKYYQFPQTNIFTNSLSLANDEGVSWSEIADFIEKNPDLVFVMSV